MHREINLVVIHCSASRNGDSLFRGELGKPGFKTPVEVIDAWHYEPPKSFRRELQWRLRQNEPLRAIGYHFVVYTAGVVATGRHEDERGAHAVMKGLSYNRRSIGVCMIGTDKFLPAQWIALRQLIEGLKFKYPAARILGHRDLSPDLDNDGVIEEWEWLKTCPGFDVAAWLKAGMTPDPKHVLQRPSSEAAA